MAAFVFLQINFHFLKIRCQPNEVVKEEEIGRGLYLFTYKTGFKGGIVAIKEFFETNGMKWENFFDRGKNIGKSQSSHEIIIT